MRSLGFAVLLAASSVEPVSAGGITSVAVPTMACPDIGPQDFELQVHHPPETPLAVSPVRALAAPSPGVAVAAHDAEIIALAVTDDDRAAVSADRRGGMRLWPSLDGAHEPVVVDARLDAQQLAIARDGDELAVAAVGAMGQLVVLRLTAGGRVVARAELDLGRPVVALRAVAGGFIALRDDQQLAGLDLHGAPRGTLGPSPGERIAELAGRRGRLLALVSFEGSVHARWIELNQQLAWGSESPPLPIDPSHAALAPDQRRLAALSPTGRTLVVVRLQDGRVDGRALDSEHAEFPVRPLGFLDPRHLAVMDARGERFWWTGSPDDYLGGSMITGPVVVTDHHLIATSETSLMLETLDDTRYLGFRMVGATQAVRHGDGWMIGDGRIVLGIDGQLAARQRYLAPKAMETMPEDVVLLDDRHWLMRFMDRIYLVDVAHPEARVLLAKQYGAVQYERTTQLLAINCGTGQWIGRYDAETGGFRESLQLARPAWIELTDPGTNRGNVAWQLVVDGATVTATAIRAIDFAADPPLRAGRSLTRALPGELRRRSPGARITARQRPSATEIAAMFAELLRADTRQRTSPDRSLSATVGGGRVALRDRSGRLRWQVALPGVVDVAWGGRGELVAFGGGMARLDLATGMPTERRCGWDFGLWREQDVVGGGEGSLCEAP